MAIFSEEIYPLIDALVNLYITMHVDEISRESSKSD